MLCPSSPFLLPPCPSSFLFSFPLPFPARIGADGQSEPLCPPLLLSDEAQKYLEALKWDFQTKRPIFLAKRVFGENVELVGIYKTPLRHFLLLPDKLTSTKSETSREVSPDTFRSSFYEIGEFAMNMIRGSVQLVEDTIRFDGSILYCDESMQELREMREIFITSRLMTKIIGWLRNYSNLKARGRAEELHYRVPKVLTLLHECFNQLESSESIEELKRACDSLMESPSEEKMERLLSLAVEQLQLYLFHATPFKNEAPLRSILAKWVLTARMMWT